MKYLIFITALLLQQSIFAQEVNLSFRNGYALGETDALRKIMLFTAATAGYEAQLRNDYFITGSIGGTSLKFSYVDSGNTNVYNSRIFVCLPVAIKKYFFINQRSDFFLQLAVVMDYCLIDKRERKRVNFVHTETRLNTGWAAGVEASCCYKRAITAKISFAIGLAAQQNFLLHYKNGSDKIQVKTNALVFAFYRRLGKQKF